MCWPRRPERMGRRLAPIIGLLVLAGCALIEPPAVAPDFDAVRAVRWRVVDDPDAVCRRVAHAPREVWRIHGCAVWSSKDATCEIWTGPIQPESNPELARALALLGHELLHCFSGQWHL